MSFSSPIQIVAVYLHKVDNVVKGDPSHLIGEMRNEIDDLIKKNIVIKIPHRHGDEVYINSIYKNEIKREMKKIYSFS